MNHTRKRLIAITAVVAVALMASIVAINQQTRPAATGVTVTNTANSVRVSWNEDAASVHQIGWTQEADVRPISNAGIDWL